MDLIMVLSSAEFARLDSVGSRCSVGGGAALGGRPVVVVTVVTSTEETCLQGEQIKELEEGQDDDESFQGFLHCQNKRRLVTRNCCTLAKTKCRSHLAE